MKKILVLTSTFPRFPGDTLPAGFIYELCRELAQRYEIVVGAPHDHTANFEERLGPIRVRRFPYFLPLKAQRLCDGVGILPNIRKSFLAKIQVPFLFLAEARFVKRLLREERPDLVHSHWAIPQGLCAGWALRNGTPQVLTIHSSDLHTLRRFTGGAALTRYITRRADHVVLVNQYLKSMLLQMAPENARKTSVFPMGVSDRFYDASTREAGAIKEQLLFVGKLIEVKGVNVLIKAMALARRRRPNLRLTVIGDGPERERLEASARELNLIAEVVAFSGRVKNGDIPPYMKDADAVVVPSIITKRGETEGTPVVILEAMAAGKPVLASNVGGIGEIVEHGRNGLLFPHSNPEHLAMAMEELYESDNLARMSRYALAAGGDYSWPSIASRYADIYERLFSEQSSEGSPASAGSVEETYLSASPPVEPPTNRIDGSVGVSR